MEFNRVNGRLFLTCDQQKPVVVVVLRPRLTSKVMLGRSVNQTTLFLGRLRPPKRLTITSLLHRS